MGSDSGMMKKIPLPCTCETYDTRCTRAGRPMGIRDWEICSQKCPPERPCTEEQSLKYRERWDYTTRKPISTDIRYLECIYLGDIIDRAGCNCPARWIRECDKHGKCTLRNQGNGLHSCMDECPDYNSTPV